MEIELKLGGLGVEVELDGVRGLVTALGVAAVAAAVAQELRLPRAERAWHGHLGGVVPYDLRPPTWERVCAAMWAPGNPDLLVPTAFGVGWTLNAAALGERLGLCAPVDGAPRAAEPEPAH